MPGAQELTLLAFLLVSVSTCEGGRGLPPKKAPLKTLSVLDPIRTSPFMVPTRKEAPTGNIPMGAIPLKAAIIFLRQGKTELQTLHRLFSTSQYGTRAWKPLPPMTPSKPTSVHQ